MPLRFRLQDLPDRFHKQVQAQLAPRNPSKPTLPKAPAPKNPDRPIGRPSPLPSLDRSSLSLSATASRNFKSPHPRNLRANKMTKPEIAFNRDFLDDHGLYEGVTLKLPGGSNYTPDWIALLDGVPCAIETKGFFRLQSEGRAHTAFFEAAANYSWLFTFIWAVYQKGGTWDIKHVIPIQFQPTPQNTQSIRLSNIDSSCVSGVVSSKREGESIQTDRSTNSPTSPDSPDSPDSPSTPTANPVATKKSPSPLNRFPKSTTL